MADTNSDLVLKAGVIGMKLKDIETCCWQIAIAGKSMRRGIDFIVLDFCEGLGDSSISRKSISFDGFNQARLFELVGQFFSEERSRLNTELGAVVRRIRGGD